jgi:hypothetical protein
LRRIWEGAVQLCAGQPRRRWVDRPRPASRDSSAERSCGGPAMRPMVRERSLPSPAV